MNQPKKLLLFLLSSMSSACQGTLYLFVSTRYAEDTNENVPTRGEPVGTREKSYLRFKTFQQFIQLLLQFLTFGQIQLKQGTLHLSFQFSHLPPFLDALFEIELHFQRVVTLENLKIIAPYQFVRQRLTFWERQVELPHISKRRNDFPHRRIPVMTFIIPFPSAEISC